MVARKAPAKKPAVKAPAKKAASKPEPTVEPEVPDTPTIQAGDDHPGYVGAVTDPEPNETYTLAGVLAALNQ